MKTAVGYFLSNGPIDSERLQSLLSECIHKAEAAGLDVKVVVADQRSNNRKTCLFFFFLFFFKVTESKPFFEHNTWKIYVMYDPSPLTCWRMSEMIFKN